MKYYWPLFEILEICLSDVSHLGAIALNGSIRFKSQWFRNY
jgi:hypothetical protein